MSFRRLLVLDEETLIVSSSAHPRRLLILAVSSSLSSSTTNADTLKGGGGGGGGDGDNDVNEFYQIPVIDYSNKDYVITRLWAFNFFFPFFFVNISFALSFKDVYSIPIFFLLYLFFENILPLKLNITRAR